MENIIIEDFIWAAKYAILDDINQSNLNNKDKKIKREVFENLNDDELLDVIGEEFNTGRPDYVVGEMLDPEKINSNRNAYLYKTIDTNSADLVIERTFFEEQSIRQIDKELKKVNKILKKLSWRHKKQVVIRDEPAPPFERGMQHITNPWSASRKIVRIDKDFNHWNTYKTSLLKQKRKLNTAAAHKKGINLNVLGDHGGKILFAAGVVALATAAYYVYKNYLSAAAKACANLKGVRKKRCMLKYKLEGAKKAIKKLQEAFSACSQKNNPQKCEFRIKQQVRKWEERIQRYQRKLSELGSAPAAKPAGGDASPFG